MLPEEIDNIQELLRLYTEYWNEGNIEGLTDMYAKDAQIFCPVTPFRAEGKEMIKTMLMGMMQAFPKRMLFFQPSTRVYNRTTIVLTNYNSWIHEDGKIGDVHSMSSQTWAKHGEQWLLVNHHVSTFQGFPGEG